MIQVLGYWTLFTSALCFFNWFIDKNRIHKEHKTEVVWLLAGLIFMILGLLFIFNETLDSFTNI